MDEAVGRGIRRFITTRLRFSNKSLTSFFDFTRLCYSSRSVCCIRSHFCVRGFATIGGGGYSMCNSVQCKPRILEQGRGIYYRRDKVGSSCRCRDLAAFHELLLPIVWSSVASSLSNRHMRRMKIKKGSAYPVSPVTCVIGIRLTIEVVHFHVAL